MRGESTLHSVGGLIAIAALLLSSCGDPGRQTSVTHFLLRREAQSDTLRFLSPIRTVIFGTYADTLDPDLTIRELDLDIGHIGDVALLGNGSPVILDRLDSTILLFDSSGRLIRRIGRSGEGPGELTDPYAVTTLGDRIVVWSGQPGRVFTEFDTAGHFLKSVPEPFPGDWTYIIRRSPLSKEKHLSVPLSEDITLRISEFDDGHFLHSTRTDERTYHNKEEQQDGFVPTDYVVRYSASLTPFDTVAEVSGPASVPFNGLPASRAPFSQPAWDARGLWTGQGGRLAVLERGTSSISVQDAEREVVLVVEWPPEQVELDRNTRLRMAQWIYARDSARAPAGSRLPRGSEKEQWANEILGILPFSEEGPEVSRLGFSGSCLLVSPFEPGANIQGVGLRILVVDAEGKRPLGVVLIPRPGGRIRTSGSGGIWTTHPDSFNALVLERFRIPFSQCQ